MLVLFNPIKVLFFLVAVISTLNILNMQRPAAINPKLLRAFAGSLKIPLPTLSHHLEISPATSPGSNERINPLDAKIK